MNMCFWCPACIAAMTRSNSGRLMCSVNTRTNTWSVVPNWPCFLNDSSQARLGTHHKSPHLAIIQGVYKSNLTNFQKPHSIATIVSAVLPIKPHHVTTVSPTVSPQKISGILFNKYPMDFYTVATGLQLNFYQWMPLLWFH